MLNPNFQNPTNLPAAEREQAAKQAAVHLSHEVYEPVFAKVASDRGLPCSTREELDELLNIAVMLKEANVNQRANVVKSASDALARKVGRTTKVASAPQPSQVPNDLLREVLQATSERQDIVNAVALQYI